MSKTTNLTPKNLKNLKKDELVQLVLSLRSSDSPLPSKQTRSAKNAGNDSICNSSSKSDINSVDNEPTLLLSQVKEAVFEAVQDLKSQLRSEYTVLLNEVKSDFKRELENARNELQAFKIKYDLDMREREVEFQRDLEEMDRRKNNLMIFGLPEAKSHVPEERLLADSDKLASLASSLDIQNLKPYKIIRLGKVGNRPRPVKVIGLSSLHREALLFSASGIRKFNEFKNVYIKPDLTPKQQLIERSLLDELRTRRAVGEKVHIRNGKIVTDVSLPKSSDVSK